MLNSSRYKVEWWTNSCRWGAVLHCKIFHNLKDALEYYNNKQGTDVYLDNTFLNRTLKSK